MSKNLVEVHNLDYVLSEGRILFQGLNFGLGIEKTAFVGRNGVGKSTLLKLLSQELSLQRGSVVVNGCLGYLPQLLPSNDEGIKVSDVLGVGLKLEALRRVYKDIAFDEDYELIGDDWSLEEDVKVSLEQVGLGFIYLDRIVGSLSGGELTQLLLARELLKQPDFLILDEPTNNLDLEARKKVYNLIKTFSGGILVVSHDRELLSYVDQVMELTSLGVSFYGGNYDFYLEEKKRHEAAAWNDYEVASDNLKKTKMDLNKEVVSRDRKALHGKYRAKRTGMGKIERKSKQGKSEKADNRICIKHERMMEEAQLRRQEAFSKLEINEELRLDLDHTRIPKGKKILEVRDLCFKYKENEPIINGFNMKVIGPQRIALVGSNGSGKTTLINLLLRKLIPRSGSIEIFTEKIVYLDQKVEILDRGLDLLDNFKKYNKMLTETECRYMLAKYLFRGNDVFKRIEDLSGGERLRAGLACVLNAKSAPELLILDEPTNHVDLYSLEKIEEALKLFGGAMLVVSHDQRFLENQEIDEVYDMSK